MSSSTPNLNLVLPVGGEHVSRAIINENNTKIDTGFGTLSEQIGKVAVATNLGSISTAAALESALVSAVSQAAQYTTLLVTFYAGGNYNGFANGSRYQGVLNVVAKPTNALYLSIIFESSKNDAPVRGNYNNGTWTWQQLALVEPVTYGDIVTGVTYNKTGNVVQLYINGLQVSASSSSWTVIATVPSSIGASRYSVHVKSISGHDIRMSGSTLSYRGSAGEIYGAITYIAM